MLTLDALRSYGANVDEGLGRCMGMESLYLRLVNMVPSEGNFAKLEEGLASRDWDKAFEAAHALKGVLGNLSLTPLYDPAVKLTELLRPKQACDYKPFYEELLKQKARFEEVLNA